MCFYEAIALPFGAISAVSGVNRVARALRVCLSRLLAFVITNFSMTTVNSSLEGLCDAARSKAEEFLGLLGWKISQGEKVLPFSTEFVMLGAQISLEDTGKGDIVVRNKPGRLEGIKQLAKPFMDGATPDAKLLASLNGKLLFAASHTLHVRTLRSDRDSADLPGCSW